MRGEFTRIFLFLTALISVAAQAHGPSINARKFISIAATTRDERTKIIELGIEIEETYSDRVWALVSDRQIRKLKEAHYSILSVADESVFTRAQSFQLRGGSREGPPNSFPKEDQRYHDYGQLMAELRALQAAHPETAALLTLGQTIEGRDLVALHLNTSASERASGLSNKPGVFFLGGHHAREHLSVEVPLMLAQYLLANKTDPKIASLLQTRDIWILPLVNPDGAEFDITGHEYHYWRKNRRHNNRDEDTIGVDLNRNYDYHWGEGGASPDPEGDSYRGKEPFSENETQAIRDFVNARPNLKTLLSFHTYSELILYPWGYSYDPIKIEQDRTVFKTMAKTMAEWNHYTPEQSSSLYISSGDTTDWAYGAHGIFAFTFELSPKNFAGGGFYPGESAIDATFRANLNACLYLIDVTEDPYRVIAQGAGASIWYK